jgi:hypothetical protein
MADKPAPLSIKWIIIGAALMGGLNWLLRDLLAEPVALPLIDSFGLEGGLIAYAALVAFLSFFGGSVLTAYMSPGDTVKEPAIASTIAIAFNVAVYMSQEGAQFSAIGTAISIAMAYAFALAGAKVGEKLQGETTDKMRERGEFGQ